MELTLTAGSHGGVRVGVANGSPLNGIEASGVSLQVDADGGVSATLDRVVLRLVRVQAGAATLSVTRATLAGVVLRLARRDPGAPSEVLGLAADDIRLEGVDLALEPGPLPGGSLTGPWRLDALRELEGRLRAFITDAKWVLDAEVEAPLANGRLDFNRVVVEHVGPNSSMGISRDSIHVDSPSGGRTDLFVFDIPVVPGAHLEKRRGLLSRVTDRGSLDLEAFVRAWLDAPAGRPIGRPADHHVQGSVDRTRLDGELRLGDGALGTEPLHLVLDGRALGKNRIGLSAAVLGERLVVRMPQMSASEAAFQLLGKVGRAGAVTAKVELHVAAAMGVMLDEVTLRNLVLGETAQRVG
jgi:hypothetical protein